MSPAERAAAPWPWPAPVDDGGAAHLASGTPLASVALPSTIGPPVDLSEHPKRAVLFIYPWAGRPGAPNPPGWDLIPGAHGSTAEAEGFRDLAMSFAELDCAVFGLSRQSASEQQELASRLRLSFPLLCDAEGLFSNALRLPRFNAGGVEYLSRLTLIVNDGRIEFVFYPVHPPDTHAAQVLKRLETQAP